MNSVPLISICIPTYNRSGLLKKVLDSLVCQEELLNGKAEIIISDNASTDDTEIIGREYDSKFEHVHYFRNEKNILDNNYPLSLLRANGVLRKLNNDTFAFVPNGLKILCDLVEKYADTKPNIFLSNGRNRSCNYIPCSFREFVINEGFWATWIQSFTIWGDDCYDDPSFYEGTEKSLWQTLTFYRLTSINDNGAVVCDQKIGESFPVQKKNISYGLYKIFHDNYLEIVKIYENNGLITKEDVEVVEKKLLYDFFTQWVISWELNKKNFLFSESEDLKRCVFDAYKSKPYWNDYLKFYKRQKLKTRLLTFRHNLLHLWRK